MTSKPQTKRNAARSIDLEFLRKSTQELIEALTSPAYVEAMLAVRSAPDEERLVEASRRLRPDALRQLGVPLPAGMRISSRYFESGFPHSIDAELGDPPDGGINLVNALNDAKPGLLDNLRVNNPECYQAIIALRQGSAVGQVTRFGGCTCGGRDISGPFGIGHGTACGGAGLIL